jgi:hypothetical protein
VNGNKSIRWSAGLNCTSFRSRDAARELFTEDIETEEAYVYEAPDCCGVSLPLAEASENDVPVCPDLLGGENGTILYFPEDAFELTELA